MSARLWIIVGICGAAGVIGGLLRPHAGGLVAKAQSDQVVAFADGDPAMAKAFAQARATLPGFMEVAERPRIGTSNFSVKVGVKADKADGGVEYVWLNAPRFAGDQVSGTVANTPRDTTRIHAGDTALVDSSAVVDWTYQDFDRMRGNFTACALLIHVPAEEREEFTAKYKLDCSAIR